ncbi:uncharacterized protein LOC143273016 isoform X4 [Peromyscus maniculatus bairdii]|uniref:uncharacterized protein LOC143273016 isoform X4 n=1 Tax=Peromyscus maniculatus bairdii TaxID=230844 RepID=UPI003FD672DA
MSTWALSEECWGPLQCPGCANTGNPTGAEQCPCAAEKTARVSWADPVRNYTARWLSLCIMARASSARVEAQLIMAVGYIPRNKSKELTEGLRSKHRWQRMDKEPAMMNTKSLPESGEDNVENRV